MSEMDDQIERRREDAFVHLSNVKNDDLREFGYAIVYALFAIAEVIAIKTREEQLDKRG